jgi:Domain of unknown function (DUF4189)
MRAALLLFLILLAVVQGARAKGSLVNGFLPDRDEFRYVISHDKTSDQEADEAALEGCRNAGLRGCTSHTKFWNICLAMAITGPKGWTQLTASTRAQAKENILSHCSSGRTCADVTIVCDGIQGSRADPEAIWVPSTFVPQMFRLTQIALVFGWTAAVVVTLVLLWFFISLVSSMPISVVKHRAVIAAWVAVPALIAGGLHRWTAAPVSMAQSYLVITPILWTGVFTALGIGQWVRRRYLDKPATPVQSLPFVALAFTIVTVGVAWVFIDHAYLATPSVCTAYEPVFSGCWHLRWQGLYLAAFMLIALVGCGVVIPPTSNLVLAYERSAVRIRAR